MQVSPAVQPLHSACDTAAAEGCVNMHSQPHKKPLTVGRRVSALLRMRAVQPLCCCLVEAFR